jgi:hypothetical protein
MSNEVTHVVTVFSRVTDMMQLGFYGAETRPGVQRRPYSGLYVFDSEKFFFFICRRIESYLVILKNIYITCFNIKNSDFSPPKRSVSVPYDSQTKQSSFLHATLTGLHNGICEAGNECSVD